MRWSDLDRMMTIRRGLRRETYHKFVKTTPKPSATKKSKGELVGPPLPELTADDVAAGEVLDGSGVVAVDAAIFAAVWTAGVVGLTPIGLGPGR